MELVVSEEYLFAIIWQGGVWRLPLSELALDRPSEAPRDLAKQPNTTRPIIDQALLW